MLQEHLLRLRIAISNSTLQVSLFYTIKTNKSQDVLTEELHLDIYYSPFGISGSPAICQQTMDSIMSGIMNDFIVWSIFNESNRTEILLGADELLLSINS